jgi:hypothetical protein
MARLDLLLGVVALTLIAVGAIDYYRVRRFRLASVLVVFGVVLGALTLACRRRAPRPGVHPDILRPAPRDPAEVADVALTSEVTQAGADAERARQAPAAMGADEVAAGLARHTRKP